MFGKLKISCEQAQQICNKAQYKEASFKEKFKLNLHILVCKICSLYVKQNSTITTLCKTKAQETQKQSFSMSEEKKQALKEQLKNINT